MRDFRWLKKKDGYVSVEAVFAMSFFMIVFLLTLAFFTYVYPYTTLQRDVHVLATKAERQGGLTTADIVDFQTMLEKYDFITDTSSNVEVTAETLPSLIDASEVTPLNEPGTDYISRSSMETIVVTVKLPSNNAFLKPVARFFGVTSLSDSYVLTEAVMSERY